MSQQVKHIHFSDIVYQVYVRGLNGFACALDIPSDFLKIGDTVVYCHSVYKVTYIDTSEGSNLHGLFLAKVE